MNELAKKHCVPCEGGMPPIERERVPNYLKSSPGWASPDGLKIFKEFKFPEKVSASGEKESAFMATMQFVDGVAEIAESEGHHPDIYIFYNLVRFELTTHAVGGLSENDFILAAKINKLYEKI